MKREGHNVLVRYSFFGRAGVSRLHTPTIFFCCAAQQIYRRGEAAEFLDGENFNLPNPASSLPFKAKTL
jgi:hypothetical protein